ncbi:MAG: T9SS type A sorting domain-containing protein [Bacteroidales bacterium]|jgi:hypothetical protein|nr:T9SS type A sorting domain-containing protein [Bacteroidales bacterium]
MKQLVTKNKRQKMSRRLILFTVLVTLINVCAWGQRISSASINYWVGSGSNEAILILNFCNDSIGLAWGYRFNGSPTAGTMFAAIDAADSRVSISGPPSGLGIYSYQDGTYNLAESFFAPYYSVNDLMADVVPNQLVANGDIFEIGGPDCAITNFFDLTFTTTNIIPVSDPNLPQPNYTIHAKCGKYGTISPIGDSTVTKGASITYSFQPNTGYHVGSVTLGNNDVTGSVTNNSYTVTNITADDTIFVQFGVDKNNTITTNDIVYWIGEGTNEAIFAVNWCDPEIAFAWGYRFDDSVLVSKVMEDIKAADARFDYVDGNGGGYVTEITYKDSTYDLKLKGSYWMYNVNEGYADGINLQYVSNNDVIEFGDESCGLSDDFWNYVWTTPVTPVSDPSNVNIISNENISVEVLTYPNPAKGYTNLTMKGWEGNVSMSIVDVNGRIIRQEQFYVKDNTMKRIETNSFSKGIYFIYLQSDKTIQTQKLIIY